MIELYSMSKWICGHCQQLKSTIFVYCKNMGWSIRRHCAWMVTRWNYASLQEECCGSATRKNARTKEEFALVHGWQMPSKKYDNLEGFFMPGAGRRTACHGASANWTLATTQLWTETTSCAKSAFITQISRKWQ